MSSRYDNLVDVSSRYDNLVDVSSRYDNLVDVSSRALLYSLVWSVIDYFWDEIVF